MSVSALFKDVGQDPWKAQVRTVEVEGDSIEVLSLLSLNEDVAELWLDKEGAYELALTLLTYAVRGTL